MTEITRTVYVANNGKEFFSKAQCQNYEDGIKLFNRKKIGDRVTFTRKSNGDTYSGVLLGISNNYECVGVKLDTLNKKGLNMVRYFKPCYFNIE